MLMTATVAEARLLHITQITQLFIVWKGSWFWLFTPSVNTEPSHYAENKQQQICRKKLFPDWSHLKSFKYKNLQAHVGIFHRILQTHVGQNYFQKFAI